MPGIENTAPERTDRSKGFFGSPRVLPVSFSRPCRCSSISSLSPAGYSPWVEYGDAQPGHLRQVSPLASQQGFHDGVALGEIVDVLAGTHLAILPSKSRDLLQENGPPKSRILTKRSALGKPPTSGRSPPRPRVGDHPPPAGCCLRTLGCVMVFASQNVPKRKETSTCPSSH